MVRRTKEEALETRNLILENALDVFSRKGYSKSTFVDIAKQIGLTKGAVYWHFKCKTDLLVALIEEAINRKCGCQDNPVEKEPSLCMLRECYLRSAQNILSDPFLRKFEFFIQFQIEWSEELILEVRNRLAKLMGQDPFKKYSLAISRLQELKKIDASHDAEKLGALLITTFVGSLRLQMLGGITEQDLLPILETHFDNLFNQLS
ncbi:TetR family transcriptional regulator [Kiritimatiellaeota bacterium B1221]|nr:TetR family transcriptional regulator [Kiritimatiellaeota bacterium B1221]